MAKVYDRINLIHKRPIHDAQIKVAQDYFVNGKKIIQSQWGRNSGKTEVIIYIATVAALLNENWWIMIVCPQYKQGKKIYWHKKRLQKYAPQEYVQMTHEADMKVEFKNGSIITVEGCENYENLRGAKPNLVIYDEFQLHSEEFHVEVMQPNLVERTSSLLVFGTPPKQRSAYYVTFREEHLSLIKKGDTERSYYEFSSYVNPANNKEELDKRKVQLYASGNEIIWLREYEGKLVFGGEDAVFSPWNEKLIKPHAVLMSALENDKQKLKWYTVCDPGTTTCFAILFIAYNPHTQQIFVLDEIYEKDRNRIDARQIWNRLKKKQEELYPNYPHKTWTCIYDEAAAWFQREIQANFKESIIPSNKYSNYAGGEETDISRIKMAMAQENSFNVSNRCYWLIWEIESYMTDEEGRFPDENDHLVDCLKYFMQRSNWKLVEKPEAGKFELYPARQSAARQIEPKEWADNAVSNSMEADFYDIYGEYFN